MGQNVDKIWGTHIDMEHRNPFLVKERLELRIRRVRGVAPELNLVLVGRERVQRCPVGQPGGQFNWIIENLFENLFEILVLQNIFLKNIF